MARGVYLIRGSLPFLLVCPGGGRLRKYRFGGIGADVGIPLRTEDLIRENLNNLIAMTIVMAATTVAVRMFRFIHHYGNIMIADGRVGDQ